MKPMYFRNYLLLTLSVICFGILLSGCQDEIDERSLQGFETEFYPLEAGKYWEYQVDSVTYAIGGSIVNTTTSYLREEIVDTYVDATGDTIARIDKYWKTDLNASWEIQKALSATVSGNQAIRTEDNLRFIKIILPPSVGTQWDGNAFIDPFQDFRVGGELVKVYKDWDDAEVIDRQSSATINGDTYNDVVTITLTDTESIIERRFAQEQFAKGVGLISAEYMILDTQCNGCDDKSWVDKAEQGFTMKQVLIAHN